MMTATRFAPISLHIYRMRADVLLQLTMLSRVFLREPVWSVELINILMI